MPDSNLLLLPQQFGTLSKRHLELVFGGFLEKVCISSHVYCIAIAMEVEGGGGWRMAEGGGWRMGKDGATSVCV